MSQPIEFRPPSPEPSPRPFEKGMVVPTPQPAKTMGLLNIIFGGCLLLCSATSILSLAAAPMFKSMFQAQERQLTAQLEAERADQIAQLEADEKAATTQAEKDRIRVERDDLAKRPVEAPPIADMMSSMFDMPQMRYWSLADGVSSIVLNGLLVASGIGLLQLKGWGRSLSIGLAWTKIVRLFAVWIAWIVFVVPPMAQKLGDSVQKMIEMQQASVGATGGGPPPGLFTRIYGAIYTATGVGMIIFGVIYPIILIMVLNRKGVKAAFEAARRDELAEGT